MKIRSVNLPTAFLLAPLAVSAAAIGVLVAFPDNQVVWKISAWGLALCLVALLVVLPVAAYALVTNPSARTWPKATAFGLGSVYIAVLIAGTVAPGF